MTTMASLAPELQLHFDDDVPVLELPASLSFEDLRDWLREVIPAQEATIGGRTCRLHLGERSIKLFDLRRLLHFLREDFSIDITGIYVLPEAIHTYAERELKLKLFPIFHIYGDTLEVPAGTDDVEADDPPETLDIDPALFDAPECVKIANVRLPHDLTDEDLAVSQPGIVEPTHETSGRRTLTLYRTLRSGAAVRFDGDLFVFGDVNPGAQLIATGNVTVLGSLKGMVHAGAAGEEDASIFALLLRPTQLRIGRKIAVAPDRGADPLSQPEMASVIGDQIVIEPYSGKLRNH